MVSNCARLNGVCRVYISSSSRLKNSIQLHSQKRWRRGVRGSRTEDEDERFEMRMSMVGDGYGPQLVRSVQSLGMKVGIQLKVLRMRGLCGCKVLMRVKNRWDDSKTERVNCVKDGLPVRERCGFEESDDSSMDWNFKKNLDWEVLGGGAREPESVVENV
jgi:hypothetical protein